MQTRQCIGDAKIFRKICKKKFCSIHISHETMTQKHTAAAWNCDINNMQ